MQVTPNQNIQKPNSAQTVNTGTTATNPAPQVQAGCCQCPTYTYPQGQYYPPQQSYYYPAQSQQQAQPQAQNLQIPATASGVNIQIFNPSVGTPGAPAPTYNVNAPCYPSGYYTGTLGNDGKIHQGSDTQVPPQQQDKGSSATSRTDKTTQSDKKTEKRKIVELTDDYIRALENSLNSQDENIRLNAGKEVYDRLAEDDSRNDDKALNALINKMLQDPSDEVRILALAALEERIAKGDDYTVNVLKKMQQSDGGYGQDAIDANKILLKMTGRQVEKEFEVNEKPSATTKTTETKTKTK